MFDYVLEIFYAYCIGKISILMTMMLSEYIIIKASPCLQSLYQGWLHLGKVFNISIFCITAEQSHFNSEPLLLLQTRRNLACQRRLIYSNRLTCHHIETKTPLMDGEVFDWIQKESGLDRLNVLVIAPALHLFDLLDPDLQADLHSLQGLTAVGRRHVV